MDEGFFQAVFAASPCAIAVNRLADLKHIAVNPAFEDTTGLTRCEVLRRTPLEARFLSHPQDYDRIREAILRDGHVTNALIETAGQGPLPRSISLSVKVFEHAGEQYTAATFIDMTERAAMEAALRQREDELRNRARDAERFREIFDATNEALLILDTTGRALDFNERACVLYGCDRATLLAERFDRFSLGTPPYSAAEGMETVRRALEEGPQIFEWRSRRAEGELFWSEVALRASKIGDEQRVIASVRDITQRKRTEEELDKSRQMLQMVLDHVPAHVFWKDRDGRYLGCNAPFASFAGLTSPQAVAGQHDADLPWGGTLAATIRAIDADVIETGSARRGYTQSAVGADGMPRWFRVDKLPLIDAHGRITGLMGFAEDISAEKRISDERELARSLLEAAIAQSPLGIIVADAPRVTIRVANAAAQKLRGWNLTGIDVASHGEKWSTFRPDGSPCPAEQLPLSRAVLQGETTREESLIVRDDDANDHWVSVNAAPIRDAEGNIRAGIAIYHDVTELKQAEQALRVSEEKFRGIAERSSEILYHADRDGYLTYVSPAVEAILGYRPEEVLGRHLGEFVCEQDRPRALKVLSRQLRQGMVEHGRYRLIHRSGRLVTAESHTSPIDTAQGVAGVQGAVHDITAECDAEERLRVTEEQLSHLARLSTLGEMIAGIAHELNHPLYAIQNLAKACRNVLGRGPVADTGELSDWCERIAAAATQAGAVVKNLRDFSRRSEFHREPAPLRGILEESLALLAYQTRRHNVTLTLDIEEDSPVVNVDRIRIQQVLVNLIRNACEAIALAGTPKREVIVQARTAADRVMVSVIDTGPGLPEHLGNQIFEPFVTTKRDGMGLGLSISMTILEGHESKLQSFSNPHGGATFQFELPLVK